MNTILIDQTKWNLLSSDRAIDKSEKNSKKFEMREINNEEELTDRLIFERFTKEDTDYRKTNRHKGLSFITNKIHDRNNK